MNLLRRIWPRKPEKDMTTTPIDNPLDYREDGSIRPGDPAWKFMARALEGEDVIAAQRDDGTWEVEGR